MRNSLPKKFTSKPIVIKHPYELFESVMDKIAKRTDKPLYPTGLKDLDDLIWGVHETEITIIGARTSHGKTSIKTNMAWNMAKLGIPIVYLSLEMSAEQIIERMFCCEMEIHGWRLRTGQQSEMQKAAELKSRFMTRLVSSTLQVLDSHGYTLEEVEQIITTLQPKVLFIDHLQRVHVQGFSSRYEALSVYIGGLKDLALKYKVAVVIGSQINRSGAKEDNAINHMKGSGDIEETGDTVVNCKWLRKDDPNYDNLNDYEIYVGKNRNGPCEKRMLYFDSRYFKFSDHPIHSTPVIRKPDYGARKLGEIELT